MTPSPDVRALSSELIEIARRDLNEEPERISSDLKSLKEWLSKQPHINARKDDQFLMSFLRGCKSSLERSKEKLDAYYTFRTSTPEFYAIRDPFDKKILKILEQGVTVPFPDPLPDGSRLMLSRFCLFNLKKYDVNDVAKVAFMMGDELLLNDDNFVVCGTVVIADVKDLSLASSSFYTPTFIKKVATFLQCCPFRLKAVHFVNVPSAFEFFFKIFSSFLSDKIKNRFYVHENVEALLNYIPKNNLPKEYGGSNESIKPWICKCKDEILSKREWFLNDSQYKTDETKRTEPLKNPSMFFGIEGSFRKLEVD